MRRVVVTGLGAVSPLGLNVETFWQRLIAGERGIGRITRFDPTGLRNERGGQIWDWTFCPASYGISTPPDLATQFLLQATQEALADAGLVWEAPASPCASGRLRCSHCEALGARPLIGAVLSTNFGGDTSWEDFCRLLRQDDCGNQAARIQEHSEMCSLTRAFSEFAFHTALSHIQHIFGLNGPLSLLSIACASGAAAIGYALDLIRAGEATIIVAGGHDALAPSPLSGLSTLHTITAEDIRPFSADRSGTLFGEGAAMLVLEELKHAKERGARIYAEVLGSWQNNNAFHLTAPDPGGAGMARVLRTALRDANLPPEKLDYINAHGTGTVPHDAAETEAIKAVLGPHAYEILVSSIKGAIAHLMGAAGAIEAIATIKAIETHIVPPTVNYRQADPACDLNVVPNQAQERPVQYAATISAGIGGSNACVIFAPPPVNAEQGQIKTSRICPAKKTQKLRRVWITGMGVISAIGIGRDDFAAGLRERREGRRPPERLTGRHNLPLLAECLDFVVEDYLESEKTYLDRCSEFALAACALAWEDAQLLWRKLDHERTGLCLGTAFGCLDSMLNMTERVQTKGVRFGSPVIFSHSFINTPASLAAIEYELQGPAATFCVGDVSAGNALDYAWRLIARGDADVMLAGGVEALSLPLVSYIEHLWRQNDLAQAVADIGGRESFVPGEGACIFVLESEAQAQQRGAQPLAEIIASYLQEPEAPVTHTIWRAPKELGHTFGACLALDLAAGLLSSALQEFIVQRCDPAGSYSAVLVRRPG